MFHVEKGFKLQPRQKGRFRCCAKGYMCAAAPERYWYQSDNFCEAAFEPNFEGPKKRSVIDHVGSLGYMKSP